MKMILYITLSIILASSFQGCTLIQKTPEPIVVKDYKYIKQRIPKLQHRPQAMSYIVKDIKIDATSGYWYSKTDASIMASNWIAYKAWAEGNYAILKSLK